jgi:hypothetical protein
MSNFKNLISQVALFLKPFGYTKKGNTFYWQESGNWGLIDFQQSKSKPENGARFTINLGTFSTRLWNLYGHGSKEKPDISMCHWRERIGSLLPGRNDLWWVLDNEASPDTLILEIEEHLRSLAIPSIKERIADLGLIDAWYRKEYGGLTDYMRLHNLTTLMSLTADPRLQVIVEEYKSVAKGKTMEQAIWDHLQELHQWTGEPALLTR